MTDDEVKNHLAVKGCDPFPMGSFIPRWSGDASWPWRWKAPSEYPEALRYPEKQQLTRLMQWSSWAWQIMHGVSHPELFRFDNLETERRNDRVELRIMEWAKFLAQPHQRLSGWAPKAYEYLQWPIAHVGDTGYWAGKLNEGYRKWLERARPVPYPDDVNPTDIRDLDRKYPTYYPYRCVCCGSSASDASFVYQSASRRPATMADDLVFLNFLHGHLGLMVSQTGASQSVMVLCVHSKVKELLRALVIDQVEHVAKRTPVANEDKDARIAEKHVLVAQNVLKSIATKDTLIEWFEWCFQRAREQLDLCQAFNSPLQPDRLLRTLLPRAVDEGQRDYWTAMADLARECAACLTDPHQLVELQFNGPQLSSLHSKLDGYRRSSREDIPDPGSTHHQIWAVRAYSKYLLWQASVCPNTPPDDGTDGDADAIDSRRSNGGRPMTKPSAPKAKGRRPVALLCAANPERQADWATYDNAATFAAASLDGPSLSVIAVPHVLRLAAQVKRLLEARCAAIHILCEAENADVIVGALDLALSGEALVYQEAYHPIEFHVMGPSLSKLQGELRDIEARAAGIVDLLEIEPQQDDDGVEDAWAEFEAADRDREARIRESLRSPSSSLTTSPGTLKDQEAANDGKSSGHLMRADDGLSPWHIGRLTLISSGQWVVAWEPSKQEPEPLGEASPYLSVPSDAQSTTRRISWAGGHGKASLQILSGSTLMLSLPCQRPRNVWQFVLRPQDSAVPLVELLYRYAWQLRIET